MLHDLVLSYFTMFISYVLLHHVMGELDGNKGAWAYVEGGMGSVSMAIARCARSHGAKIFTNMVILETNIILLCAV